MMKQERRDLGSRYLGRAIKKWRLIANLSQVDLAERAGVSTTLVGTVERERGHISPEIFCRLCLGLESDGRSVLAAVLQDAVTTWWAELSALEVELRERLGRPRAGSVASGSLEHEVAESTERACEALKRWASSWQRILLSINPGADRFAAGSILPPPAEGRRSRVRSRKRKTSGRGERLGKVIVKRKK